ncbi:hypothetical protein [Arthrobacter sp. D3-16]
MQLTAYIISAADGELLLGAEELPALRTTARNVEGIAGAVQAEAARLTGHSLNDIHVQVPF